MIFLKEPENFNPTMKIVSCFVQFEDKIILLHRQDHKPQGNTWGTPAGKIDKNETPQEAILREVKEEINLNLDPSKLSFFKRLFVKYPDVDFTYDMFSIVLEDKPEIKLRLEEHKDFKWVTPQDALKMNLIEDEDECIKLFFKI